MELVKREFKQTKGEMVFNKSQYAGKIASIFFTLLLHCNVNSDVMHSSMLLGKWIIQVSLMLFCGFKKQTQHIIILGQRNVQARVRAQTQVKELFQTTDGSNCQKLCSHLLGTCHKAYYLSWVDASKYIWKDFIKVLKDPLGINAYCCCQCYLRTSGGRHFKIEVQLLFPEALLHPALLCSLSNL